MSARRLLAGSVAALLLPASLILSTDAGSATDADAGSTSTAAAMATARKAGQKITLEVLPQIVQPGRGTASANSAKAAVTATIKPVKVGRPVVLEQQRGSSWKKVGKATQDKSGRAQFAALVSKSGKALTYRVTAQSFKGLKSITSKSADTAKWLVPTFTDEFSGSTLSPMWGMRGQVSRKKTKNISYRLNGHVGTDKGFSFRYGVAAARIKMQKLQGQHASFWMQPVGENQPGSDGHEIDVIEYFGDEHPQGGLTSFIHWYKGQSLIKTGSWIKNSTTFFANKRDGWSKNYHVFSVQWTPQVLIFRIDGKETWRTSARVSKAQQYLILSLLASDYEALEMPDKKLPQQMYVDWVRVWETPVA